MSKIMTPDLVDLVLGLDRATVNGAPIHSNFPPFNVVKIGDDCWDIEVALAGYSDKDLDISLDPQKGLLVIRGNNSANEEKNVPEKYIHRGIASRKFLIKWPIERHVKVKEAKLLDGILTVSLVKEVPEEEKPIKIEINSSKPERQFLTEDK